ncbi:MAG: esterase-like activity of phytase family protein [Rhodobacteraceae bacterium]|nr:esterase-like activity of phytase family protein [Paracoccaceae bacterium]MCP5342492.1 esterase-like activity of phytase family protein [Paracoccaceae bacterium]
MRAGSVFAIGLVAGLGFASPVIAAPHAVYVGTYVWHEDSPLFGGLSALDLGEDGEAFVTVSDSAAIFAGRFSRNAQGAVTGVEAGAPFVPLSHHGTPIRPPMDDAEGIALLPGGGLAISYETQDRIGIYGKAGRTYVTELWADALKHFEPNYGAEALAADAEGTLYTMPEKPLTAGGDFPIYRYRNAVWDQPFALVRKGNWRPVGADFGQDGRLYVLERDYWGLIGFMSRVRRLTLAGDSIVADELLLETGAGIHDNLEGLAVWRDGAGKTRLTMISDDNFLPTQRTEIVDYRVEE